ncbi:Carboxypeptidase M [Chelonia mydas]|uniref:Carboxypeptidase M n=1 Tax=Chelonia mydas TaxID=8469 RepID=M7BPW7_CHEMY|nr:Carboxypeptidase M [Chelonia mydas]
MSISHSIIFVRSNTHCAECLPVFTVDWKNKNLCFLIQTVGRELLLHLIDFLVTNDQSDPVVTKLIDSTRIHIMPSMNPDGFEATTVHDCYYSEGRFNKNGKDLNRNFPDVFNSNNVTIQPETQAVINWIKNETFVLSANLHGGALVASYTFDNGNPATGSLQGYSRSQDDDVFIHLAKTYSSNHASMYKGNECGNKPVFPYGITNGYAWYPLQGGMQDYNYIWGQCFEITLELSCCKYPPANQLQAFWNDNKAALIEYIKQVHLDLPTDLSGASICTAATEPKSPKIETCVHPVFGKWIPVGSRSIQGPLRSQTNIPASVSILWVQEGKGVRKMLGSKIYRGSIPGADTC